jgi:hypothetical protein
MAEASEPEVLDARRAFPVAQALLAGEPLDALPTELAVGWHDTSVHPETGAFAVVGIDSGMDDWIGEVLRVNANGRACFVYVMGAADVPTPLSLARRAFASLSALSAESVLALVDVIA